ncbi:MAG: hypothetical protein V1859_06950 [archaeon]
MGLFGKDINKIRTMTSIGDLQAGLTNSHKYIESSFSAEEENTRRELFKRVEMAQYLAKALSEDFELYKNKIFSRFKNRRINETLDAAYKQIRDYLKIIQKTCGEIRDGTTERVYAAETRHEYPTIKDKLMSSVNDCLEYVNKIVYEFIKMRKVIKISEVWTIIDDWQLVETLIQTFELTRHYTEE